MMGLAVVEAEVAAAAVVVWSKAYFRAAKSDCAAVRLPDCKTWPSC